MDQPREIELKLELAPEHLLRLRHSPLLHSEDEATDHLVSFYFDTADHMLRKAGYMLRVRQGSDGNHQTVKRENEAAAGLFARPEWEKPIEGERPVLGPEDGPITELVDGQYLAPAFRTEVDRSVRNLTVGGARIEAALDAGGIQAGRRRRTLCEIELELKAGPPEPLFTLAREMNAIVPLRLGVRSKAERGYALAEGRKPRAIKAEPITLDPMADTRSAFASITAACIRQFRLNEPLLLKTGGVESLHQARVAIRRLRSAFSLFKPLLASDPRSDYLRGELRWLADMLGRVRDLDVLLEGFEGAGKERLAEARAAAMAETKAGLESVRARELMIDLAEWLAIGAWRNRPTNLACAAENVAHFAADLLDRRRTRIKRHGRHLQDLSDGERHRVRIEAKKLRYAGEFFASLWTSKAARWRHHAFQDALEALQDHLGELNDRAIAHERLAELDIEEPDRNDDSRHDLIRRAEQDFADLVKAKPFWRA